MLARALQNMALPLVRKAVPGIGSIPSRNYKLGFYSREMEIVKTPAPRIRPKGDFPFGRYTTDHMLEIDWDVLEGWSKPKISCYHPLMIDPACSALHYGVQCFEGMKAYYGVNGDIRLYRPQENFRRLNRSAAALSLPQCDPIELQKCVEELVLMDRNWIPTEDLHSLYIRPTLISMHNKLGVQPAQRAKLFVILSPTGSYWAGGFQPVNLWCEIEGARAGPGGSGDHKLGGNYGNTMKYYVDAVNRGFHQIMWFTSRDWVAEVGTMNLFFVWINENGEKEMITPILDGTILPGITRNSIIQLAEEGLFGMPCVEKKIHIDEILAAINEGRVLIYIYIYIYIYI